MTIDRLPSGNYRVRQQVEGVKYSLTFDHRPTQREVAAEISKRRYESEEDTVEGSFYEGCQQFVKLNENVLSPRTIREYLAYARRLPQWFTKTPMKAITQEKVQRVINEISIGHSPKTVACYNGFITSVMGLFRPGLSLKTNLPQRRLTEPYIPSEEDVKTILKEAQGTHYEVALRLACYGLRRSEICALGIDDLSEEDVITIDKALVEGRDGNWVIKTTKTTDSTRSIPIDHELAEMIREQGYVFKGYPQSISNYLARTQQKLGMEHFSIHKFRHFFASRLMEMEGVTQKDIQALGGWKGDETLKRVYQHSLKTKTMDGKKEITSALAKNLFG